ncbi:MAG: hypothetical protein L6Q99_15345 [Planctomycetes bacterium]|nr:hypothetical protein [Planctomycetota bacterium]
MRSSLALVLGVVVGLAAAAAFFASQPAEPPKPEFDTSTPDIATTSRPPAVPTLEPSASPADRRTDPLVDSGASSATAGTDPRFSPALERYARDGITVAWKRLRSQPIPDATLELGWQRFREAVLALPEQIGTDLATTANQRDELAAALAGADAFGLLAQLKSLDVGPFEELVGDAARFEALFACSSGGGPVLDGSTVSRTTEVPDGSELRYPAGVHRVDLSRLGGERFPRCLAVRGAGMDRTLLVWEELSTRSRVERIEISDVTLKTEYMFDLRSELATIVLDRVRIVGFDAGAGASCVLATAGNALHVRDSRIEGGYGRLPGSGVLFDVRTPALLARFDRCVLSGLAIPTQHLRDRSTVVFSNCRFDDTLEPDESFASGKAGRVFVDCSHTTAPLGPHGRPLPPKRDLNELFPGWESAR